jgi:hypothetical protein
MILLKVLGFMKMDPRTTASLRVSVFLLTSTILARPFLSKCVSFGIFSSGKIIVWGGASGLEEHPAKIGIQAPALRASRL